MVKNALIKSGIKRDRKQTHAITKRRLIEHTRDAVRYPEMIVPDLAHTVKKIVKCSINMKTRQSAQVPVTRPRIYCHLKTDLARNKTVLPSSRSRLNIFMESMETIRNIPAAIRWKAIFETCQATAALSTIFPLTVYPSS